MTALAVSNAINHHQTFLGNGRVHAGGLTNNSHIYLGQFGQCQRKASRTADLFLTRSEIYYIIRYAQRGIPILFALRGSSSQNPIHLQQAHQTAATVVGP